MFFNVETFRLLHLQAVTPDVFNNAVSPRFADDLFSGPKVRLANAISAAQSSGLIPPDSELEKIAQRFSSLPPDASRREYIAYAEKLMARS